MMNYDRSYPIQSNFDHHYHHHPSLSSGSTSYGNAKENKMYGGHYNQQYNQQQYQYGHYDNSNYDYGNVAYNTVNATDEGDAGMAGVGARRMAERAAAQRQKAEEKRQRQMEEERRYYEQQKEEQRRYELRQRQEEEERRQREYEAEEQKRYQMEQQRREKYRYEEEKHRRNEKERQEQRSRAEERLNNLFSSSSKQKSGHSQQNSTEDSIWGNREIPAEEGTYHGTTLNTHKKDVRSRSSDQFWKAPQSKSNSQRQQTDSQSTAKQQDYRKAANHESQKMVSDGFGGLMLQVSEPKPNERISKMTDARQTVYDDDYEETEQLDTNDNDDEMWLKTASITRSPQKLNVPLSGDSKGVVVRQTVLEPLPKATCADCGDQLPFEDLVGHECVRNACLSPLLTKGAGSISSRSNSPMLATSEKKGTFFDRYDRARDENNNRAFLSPALTSGSPAHSPRSVTSPLIGSDYNGSNLDEEEEKQRQERKRQIEAQRAAKKQALLLQTKPNINSNDRAISPSSATSLSPVDHHKGSFERPKEDRSHRRGAESHSSSISTVSTKSSTSSFFMKPGSGTLTPSSSNELVCSTGSLMTKPFRKGTDGSSSKKMTTSPSKKVVNLEDIEGLMREIDISPVEDRKISKDQHQRKDNSRNANLDPKDAALRNRRPSESSSRNRSGTAASEVNGKKMRNRSNTDASDRNQRPLISRTRTQDQQKNTLCSVCLCAFKKDQPIVKRDGKLFCVDDYAELFLEKCRKCHEPVKTVGVRSRDGALTGLFHRECFSCLQCDASFDDGTFYIFENAAYCSHHYHVLNGTICQGCQTGIEGQCRQLTETGERFHQHCLTCQFDNGKEFCQELLHDYFFYGGKRFCEWHFEKVIQAVKKRENKNKNKIGQSNDAIAAAEIRKARRTTYLRTVAAKKGRT